MSSRQVSAASSRSAGASSVPRERSCFRARQAAPPTSSSSSTPVSPERDGPSDARVAQAADVDLDLTLLEGARRLRAAHGELELGQTFDAAALDADEMRMRHVVIVARHPRLEAPHVVADIGAAREAGLDQIDEVAVDRRAVPRLR